MRVISGMQTGADIGGVKAAKELGLETGGWMPAGFRTEDGPRPEYAELYGAKCTKSHDYPMRTRMNVYEADATIIFGNINSPGCRLTKRSCEENDRPFLHVPMGGDAAEIVYFLIWEKPKILNIAGNREKSTPGIEEFVIKTLKEALSDYRQ